MNSSIHYASTNPLVNAEDIKDHNGVGAVIHHPENHERILIFFHNKYKFWTIPIGKSALNEMVDFGIVVEAKEETNINIKKMQKLGMFAKTYDRGKGIQTYIESHLFDVIKYTGIPENMESHKHPTMVWLTIEELEKYDPIDLSDMTRFYIYLQKGILNIPSVKLIQ